METIKFQSTGTQSANQRMKALKQKWVGTTCKAPESAEAKGAAFAGMQKIGEEYELLHEAVSVLMENTIQFFQKTEETFVNVDEKLKEEIGG